MQQLIVRASPGSCTAQPCCPCTPPLHCTLRGERRAQLRPAAVKCATGTAAAAVQGSRSVPAVHREDCFQASQPDAGPSWPLTAFAAPPPTACRCAPAAAAPPWWPPAARRPAARRRRCAPPPSQAAPSARRRGTRPVIRSRRAGWGRAEGQRRLRQRRHCGAQGWSSSRRCRPPIELFN